MKKFPEGSVCKPCWELKYCPYGWTVELFPHPWHDSYSLEEIEKRYSEQLKEITSGNLETESEVWSAIVDLLHNNPAHWEDLPEYDPKGMGCKFFGHVCPVFFTQSPGTETVEHRNSSRYIRREIMLKVVRRDDHICQECYEYMPDNQVEFDHVIPLSRGGATTVDNLRLLCRTCNRKKSNAVDGLLVSR